MNTVHDVCLVVRVTPACLNVFKLIPVVLSDIS